MIPVLETMILDLLQETLLSALHHVGMLPVVNRLFINLNYSGNMCFLCQKDKWIDAVESCWTAE